MGWGSVCHREHPPDWSRGAIAEVVQARRGFCAQGACSEVYLETAFEFRAECVVGVMRRATW